MIRTEALTKFYGPRCAVRDLTLSIQNREIVGFLGLNGAGKTTTLRMLAGLLAPSSGRIEIDGRDMAAEDAHDVRWRIGFLPERPPLYEDMTVRRYLDFAARLKGCSKEVVDKRIKNVLELTSTESYADEPVRSLSHGFRQRVGIAQAVIHDPALVILDEPTAGLDPVQIVEMRTLIRELKAQHTVLISSHNLPEISQTCDRLMVIRDGELIDTGSEDELASRMGAVERVLFEVTGETEQVTTIFDGFVSEELVTSWSHEAKDGVIEVQAALATKEIENLAKTIVESGLGLRRMQPVERELEDLFLQLTKGAS